MSSLITRIRVAAIPSGAGASLAVLVVIFVGAVGSAQSTLVVPSQYTSIQAAISAAVDGDVVQVLPGIYSQPIDMLGKRIELRSSSGATVTILDGQNLFPVIRLSGAETDRTVIDGFTIRNGLGMLTTLVTWGGTTISWSQGGGILGAQYAASNGITVRNCIIRDNIAATGAGIFMEYIGSLLPPSGKVVIEDCEFIGNSCAGIPTTTQQIGEGIALFVYRREVSMTRCRVSGTSVGSVFLSSSSAIRILSETQVQPLIQESEVLQSGCRYGIHLISPGNLVANCLVVGGEVGVNLLDGGGIQGCVLENQTLGGVVADATGAVIENCHIRNSPIGIQGKSRQVSTSSPADTMPQTVIRNTLSVGNAIGLSLFHVDFGVGVFYGPAIRGCSFVGNSLQVVMPPQYANAAGVGVHVEGSAFAEFDNCIIYGNPTGGFLSSSNGSICNLVANSCDIQGGWSGSGSGNFNLPPQFVASPFDLHLEPGSPCIDAGGIYSSMGTLDIDGEPRLLNGAPDIGADEFLIAPSAAHGTVGAAAPSGQPERVLSVNGSTGTYGGLVDLGVAEPIQLVLSQPSSHALPSNFVLWMKLEIPAPSEVMPTAFGDLAFLPYHADPAGSGSGVLADTFFVDPAAFVGVQAPAPFGFLHPGLPFPLTVTIQGAMEDTGAAGPTIGVTNTIVLRIQ